MKKPSNTSQQAGKDARNDFAPISEFRVLRVHMFDNGNVTFDMRINEISIYGLRVVEGKDGKPDFISWPQRKGADGKYYSIAWAKLSDETTAQILAEVERQLNE